MSKCSVKGCNEESGRGTNVSFHILKKNEPEEVKEVWRKFAEKSRVKSSFCICSKHFTPDDFITSEIYRKYYPNSKAKLKPGAIPTIPVEKPPPQHTRRQVPKVVVVKYVPTLQNDDTNTSEASCSTSVETMEMESNMEMPEAGSELSILDIKPTTSVMLEEQSAQCRNMENEKLELMKEIEEKTIELQRLQDIEEELAQVRSQAQSLKKEKQQLQRQIASLKSSNEQLTKTKQEKENMEEILLETFSQNELDLLLKRKSHVAWKRKEIEEAFLIQYLHLPCYKYLRNKKRYPLPSVPVIHKWMNQYGIRLEVLNDIEIDSD